MAISITIVGLGEDYRLSIGCFNMLDWVIALPLLFELSPIPYDSKVTVMTVIVCSFTLQRMFGCMRYTIGCGCIFGYDGDDRGTGIAKPVGPPITPPFGENYPGDEYWCDWCKSVHPTIRAWENACVDYFDTRIDAFKLCCGCSNPKPVVKKEATAKTDKNTIAMNPIRIGTIIYGVLTNIKNLT